MHQATPEMPQSRLSSKSLTFIFLLATAARCLWALTIPASPQGDSVAYDILAQNVANGVGYAFVEGDPSAYWPPGTSFIYAALYRIFGHTYTPITVLHIIANSSTCAICALLANRWYGTLAGMCSGILMAIWPSQIMFTTVLSSELLFNLMIVVALLFSHSPNQSSPTRFIGTTCSLAIATIIRPTAILIPFIIFLRDALAFLPRIRCSTNRLAQSVIMVVAIVAILSPWSIRNHKIWEKYILVSTNGGPNFWMGNHEGSTGGYTPLPQSIDGMNEVERAEFLKKEAVDYITQNPVNFVKMCFKRTIMTFDRESIAVVWNSDSITNRLGSRALMPLKAISSLYWYLILALAVAAVYHLTRSRGLFSLTTDYPFLMIAYFGGIHAIVVGGDRYHLPTVPFLACLAGLTLSLIYSRLRIQSVESGDNGSNPTAANPSIENHQ